MSDPELEAIRRARIAELRSSSGSGLGSGSGSGSKIPSSGANSTSMDAGDEDQDGKQAQQEEMKRQALSTILEVEARDRLSRISLVKPEKSKAIQDLLIRMAQSGQVRQRVSEQQLIALLDQVEGANNPSAGPAGATGKIIYTRKKTLDDDEDDFDL